MHAFNSLVWDAAEAGAVDALRCAVHACPQLIDAANPSRWGQTPLAAAAAGGHVDAMSLLLRCHAAVDALDARGRSPLHAAARTGQAAAIAVLLAAGSRLLDAADADGWTPLHTAAASRQPHAVVALIQAHSTAIDVPSRSGWTPLATAALCNDADTVQLLKCLGATCTGHLSRDVARLVDSPVPAALVAATRRRVYFDRSLLDRLLCQLGRSPFSSVTRPHDFIFH